MKLARSLQSELAGIDNEILTQSKPLPQLIKLGSLKQKLARMLV